MNKYTLKDIYTGMEESFSCEITAEMENSFRKITGDFNPLHYDDEFAQKYFISKTAYGGGGHVTFGMLTASFLSTMAGMYLPGMYSLIHSVEISFTKPVYAGDILNFKGEVTEVNQALKLIRLRVTVTKFEEVVCKAKMKVLILEQEENL